MTIEALHRVVVDGFKSVDDRFAVRDRRSDAVDERFDTVDKRFEAIEKRFDAVDERVEAVDNRFDIVEKDLRELRTDIEARIKEDGEATRRHFNVMVEKVEAAVRIVAEDRGDLQTVADNHEVRRRTIEKRT